jgi:DNA polymerase-3 subunit beta
MTTTVQFRGERDTLLATITNPGRAAATRGYSLPVLTGLRVEAANNRIAVTGTDLELTITASGDAMTDVPGTVVLPARLTADIIRSLEPGVVTVTVEDESCKIEGGRSNFDVRVLPADEFPRLAVPDLSAGTVVDGQAFGKALAQVVPAAGTDDARPILTGVLISQNDGDLRLVATDSYRLATRDLPGIGPLQADDVNVPARALAEVGRLIGKNEKVTVILGARDVTFASGDTVLTSVLIQGEFPPYKRLIPDTLPNSLTVEREHFIEAVTRVSLLAREATPIRMAMTADGVELRAITQDVGEAVEPVDGIFSGNDLTCAFNPLYMRQGLESCTGDTVTLLTTDALKPALLRSQADPTFTYLLMPVRVS